ncbi:MULTISPECIES: zf-HC2 domain-containing protein [unclassified Corynebacterium]|uniref:zf-HC2 domain-containing protein n=1 Tax=unclassified Corynebacterium TaxID=2624378 RepID=UPI0029CA80EA|nr:MULTISPECIES: zf-HC2 domain-containing protein [unclassified Corynebacterium]WPF66794.1 zf-HC2 domain-containing protein [Corynebacterium sp. 22KM0430]WPF69282.1 zf-HC2 domain-containing protein [Corynebacterium sp. 21KM1197]
MIAHEAIQAELSARLDGEAGRLDRDVVEAHLDQCEQCQAYYRRAARLQPVPPPTDQAPGEELTRAILAEVEPEWRRHSGVRLASLTVARLVLVLVAVLHVVSAVRLLADTGGLLETIEDGAVLSPAADPTLAHLLAQAAAVRLALAAALLLGAWLPRLLLGVLPLLGAWTMFSLGFGMRDFLLGNTTREQILGVVALAITTATAAWVWVSSGGWSRWRAGLLH